MNCDSLLTATIRSYVRPMLKDALDINVDDISDDEVERILEAYVTMRSPCPTCGQEVEA